ncbi:MAG: FixH family protein [Phycisphaerales bacterium]|nr:FixH family protein [Phycisphaerales bacterium]
MSSTVLTTPAVAPERKSWLWPNAVYALIGMNLIVVAVTIYAANRDPSFAVEPNYDTKALEWNKTAAQIEANQRLGWTLAVENWPVARGGQNLTIRLTDSVGRPLEGATVELTAFASVRASTRLTATLIPSGPGVYTGPLPIGRSGLWEFRFTVKRGPETFTRSIEQEIAGS